MSLEIGVLMPEVLGTYGDSGNAVVLAARARKRGIEAQIVEVSIADPIPQTLDIYTIGGGEDAAQHIAAHKLATDPGLANAVAAGKPVLAICAALQVLGHWYTDAAGAKIAGAGLIDAITVPGGSRAIGELRAEPGPDLAAGGATQTLYGFENHGGMTALGPDAAPLSFVTAGVGNWADSSALEQLPDGYYTQISGKKLDGIVQGGIFCSYMHGPVLARNPQLTDLILARALGTELSELAPLEITAIAELRAQRETAINGQLA